MEDPLGLVFDTEGEEKIDIFTRFKFSLLKAQTMKQGVIINYVNSVD